MEFTCDVSPSLYSYSEPVARKEHHCCECGGKILKGERYFRWAGTWEDSFSNGCQHLLCMETCMMIRDKFNGYECIPFGAMLEWWAESKPYRYNKNQPCWKALRANLAKILWRKRRESHR